MRKVLLVAIPVLLLLGFILYKTYHLQSAEEVKPGIEKHIDTQFGNQFDIVRIQIDYSQDLFKQPVGYKLWLKDKTNSEFGPVFIQFNTVQNDWITYGGSDIEKEYRKAKFAK